MFTHEFKIFQHFVLSFKLQEIYLNVQINIAKMTNLVKIVIVQLLFLHQEFFL